jgi:hypothetical protein
MVDLPMRLEPNNWRLEPYNWRLEPNNWRTDAAKGLQSPSRKEK